MRTRSIGRVGRVCLLMVVVTTWVLVAAVAWGALAAQPADKKSTLVDKDGAEITDSEFSGWMKDLLAPGGANDVKDATFLFQQCYGGGMLDNLQADLGATVKWVGGSASDHSEPAIGEVSTAENVSEGWDVRWVADPPESYWTKELKGKLGEKPTVLEAVDSSNASDTVDTTEQSASANGGNTIVLHDPTATSHHAILWAGDADHMRHFNNIKNVRDTLTAKWGNGADVSITVLYGNGATASDGSALPAGWGAKAGTKQNLKDAIDALKPTVNANEQFFFYSSDHGGVQTVAAPVIAPAGGDAGSTVPVQPGEKTGMTRESGNQPYLKVEHNSTEPNSVAVKFAGTIVGYLDPAQGSGQTFSVPESLISAGSNAVVIHNEEASPVSVSTILFGLGGIGENPDNSVYAVPATIGSIALAGVGLLAAVGGILFARRPLPAAG